MDYDLIRLSTRSVEHPGLPLATPLQRCRASVGALRPDAVGKGLALHGAPGRGQQRHLRHAGGRETGQVNLVICKQLAERVRRTLLGACLMDYSHLLGGLVFTSRDFH
jgi:hypothetical protein